jgi:hypothetical protein
MKYWIIDHSTTTNEAASHAGGDSGKGGDLLYRWGNPRAYRRGVEADQKLFGQHHVHWVKEGLTHAGKIMVFNNQHGADFSSVNVIGPLVDGSGTYVLENGKFGPIDQDYIYKTSAS